MRDGTGRLNGQWTARADGTHQRRLTQDQANFSDWAPDGDRIAFDFIDDTGVHIASITPNGLDRRALTSTPGIQECPKWSPDGKSIVYDAISFDQPTFSIAIWVMGADGSKPTQLTRDALDVEPVFSPDGTRIAFGRITGDSPEGQLEAIYVINSDGTGLREVVAPRAGLEHPDWSPDGREMLSGCFDTQARIDRLCTVSPGGRVKAVISGPPRVNFPSWGSED